MYTYYSILYLYYIILNTVQYSTADFSYKNEQLLFVTQVLL